MLQGEVLILKFLPMDGLDPCAVRAFEVTTLAYESQNDSVKAGTFMTKSLLPSAQITEVCCCFWKFVCKQLKEAAAQGSQGCRRIL